jgi:hypothetical protein
LLLSTFIGLQLGAIDGSWMGFEAGAEVLGDPDGSILGMTIGVLLGSLKGLLLPTFVGLWLGALDGLPLEPRMALKGLGILTVTASSTIIQIVFV